MSSSSHPPSHRPWFWALEAGGHGPDWHFFAHFADAAGLLRAVTAGLSDAFVRDVDFRDPSDAAVRRYVDRHTFDRLTTQRTRGVFEPVYYHGEVRVADGWLHMQHVLSGALYDETGLLVSVLSLGGLGLGAWRVAYGGDFGAADVATGEGAATLRDYLMFTTA
jgi:hypothetical protein